MGIIDWFKDTKDNKEDLLKSLSRAISKTKKGNSIDKNLINIIAALSLEEIENVLLPYYLELPADDRGYIRKWLIEGSFSERVKIIFKAKDIHNKIKILELILRLRLNPGTPLLVELLSDKDEGVRWLVSDILKQLQPRDGISLLIEKLKFPLKYPPARIGEILVSYGDRAIEGLFNIVELEGESSGKAIAVLGLMPLGKVFSCLNKALSSNVEELQLAALEALGEKEYKEYEELPISVVASINETTKHLLKANDPLIRIKAVNILCRLPIDNEQALYDATLDENKVVRNNALKGLKSKSGDFSDVLKEIEKNKDHPLHDKV